MKTYRETKYCSAIRQSIQALGHATNAELLTVLRVRYPELSATTVHRATSRLAGRGEIAYAPADAAGAMRYDANTTPHDHFVCTTCGFIRDVDIIEKIRSVLETCAKGCAISGRVAVSGTCERCKEEI